MERKKRAEPQQASMFHIEPSWRDKWWGMPAFEMGDCRPQHKITLNFMTAEDVADFARVTGLPVTTSSDTAWFPHQAPLRGRYVYRGPPTPSRYPVCIPSKGRADNQRTAALLGCLGVDYRVFVEETEADAYIATLGAARVVVMPFHDLGEGSIPARNHIWEWAAERGHARHWVVDDNICAFYRTHNNRRLRVLGGGYFAAMEDFVDRYDNIALAGPNDVAFVADRAPGPPVTWNSRVYSCILVDTALPHRWRGRYNEDTDLSLRCLKEGRATCLFRALAMDKPATAGGKGTAMAGGNTDHVYNTGDHRLAFAESLRDQHPDVVRVAWKYNRWHHEVDYRSFADNDPMPRPVTPHHRESEYGMRLVDVEAEPVDGS